MPLRAPCVHSVLTLLAVRVACAAVRSAAVESQAVSAGFLTPVLAPHGLVQVPTSKHVGDDQSDVAKLQASIVALKAKLDDASKASAALKEREAAYIARIRKAWDANSARTSSYQERQVKLNSDLDSLRSQYAKRSAECLQQHLPVHREVGRRIAAATGGATLVSVRQPVMVPAGYDIGAALIPAGVVPGGQVIVVTHTGPMLVTPPAMAHVGEKFEFLFPVAAAQAAAVPNNGAPATLPVSQAQAATTESPAPVVGPPQPAASVPTLPFAAVARPGDLPAKWPTAGWRLNFTYADVNKSPWQKWLAPGTEIEEEGPASAPGSSPQAEGPSRYALLKLERQLMWQLQVAEKEVVFYQNLMVKYDATVERASLSAKTMSEHISTSEANYAATSAYLKQELTALEKMCASAADLQSAGGQQAIARALQAFSAR